MEGGWGGGGKDRAINCGVIPCCGLRSDNPQSTSALWSNTGLLVPRNSALAAGDFCFCAGSWKSAFWLIADFQSASSYKKGIPHIKFGHNSFTSPCLEQ